MSTSTASQRELQVLQADETLLSIQDALGTSFDFWYREPTGWSAFSELDEEKYAKSDVERHLEQAVTTKSPQVVRVLGDDYLIVMPLQGSHSRAYRAATTIFETKRPKILSSLLRKTDQCRKQEQELGKLREENAVFLQQVSEDFEELTFLRSMAENLTLEDNGQGLARLTEYTLALLGQTVGVESLYFVDASVPGKPRIKHEWHDSEFSEGRFPSKELTRVTLELSRQAADRPVVKNCYSESDYIYDIPGVKHLVLVPVFMNYSTLGWLLAINRNNRRSPGAGERWWKLSQNELGTREASLLSTAAAMLASHAHNLALLDEREALMVSVVRTLVSAVDSRDPYTCGHSERVARFAKRLAQQFDFDDNALERLYLTGLLHDIGKIGISDAVLKKTGPLTKEEYAEIMQHPDLGWAILRELEHFDYVLPGVLHHHERMDGKGYPDGLHGHETPFEGRLLAVVDAFDAMTSDRPYRKGMPVEKACQILREGSGTQWDSTIVETFLDILPEIEELRIAYQHSPLPSRKERELQEGEAAIPLELETIA